MTPLLPAALLAACVAMGGVGLLLLRSAPAGAGRLLREAAPEGGGEAGKPPDVLQRLRRRAVDALAPKVLDAMSERRRQQLQHRIDAAGRPGGLTLEGYVKNRLTATVLLGVVGLALLIATWHPLALALPALGWFGYDVQMRSRAKRRQDRIERDLPDFLDVLSITVRAGLGFRGSMERVAASLGGPVGDEIQTTLRQMSVGMNRRAAFEALRERNDAEGFDQFASALLQAEELGTPLSEAIQDIAADLRQTFAQEARRRAAKASPRINVIVVFVVVPGAALLLLGTFLLSMDWGGLGGPGG